MNTTRDHSWWRPGWSPRTRYLTWHVTVDDQPAVHRLAATYQRALMPLADVLPPVVPGGLHVTVSGVGHREDVKASDLATLVDAVRGALAELAAISAPLGRAHAGREAVVLPLGGAGEVARLREVLRSCAAAAWGPARVVDAAAQFRPHLSLAYAAGEVAVSTVQALLDTVVHEPTDLAIETVSLILLRREHGEYRWDTVHVASLRGSTVHRAGVRPVHPGRRALSETEGLAAPDSPV